PVGLLGLCGAAVLAGGPLVAPGLPAYSRKTPLTTVSAAITATLPASINTPAPATLPPPTTPRTPLTTGPLRPSETPPSIIQSMQIVNLTQTSVEATLDGPDVQAAADSALLATAQKWPVSFIDNFSAASAHWVTTTENNDYYFGTKAITKGVFEW